MCQSHGIVSTSTIANHCFIVSLEGELHIFDLQPILGMAIDKK
jgi:hypothetical protein